MMEILRWFAGGQQIAGVDICGEPDHREALPEELRQSSRVTRCLADF